MKSQKRRQNAARNIITFTDSYEQNKQRKQNEQQKSESTLSLAQVVFSLQTLRDKIWNNNACKYVIETPNLLKSLITLVTFRLCTRLREEANQQSLEVRNWSRWCLRNIQDNGDEQVHSEIDIQEYGRVISFSYSTSGGKGEEQNQEIFNGLNFISRFLRALHEGRNYQPQFQPLPLLARRSDEQLEEEGANEEIDAQMKNNGLGSGIKNWANEAKAMQLNRFIYRH
ncbi:MAG: hypothetical protein EZS28_022198 [Streblomastix strix]|uniref:Uncharacterized protein n=1 Tax=Streblomastix strix TaxID=222440 RepID=A0A5J4VII7_9EUKA|nr:MAG: hypothetical protein EZS28_022198 [Streblomastix strix]